MVQDFPVILNLYLLGLLLLDTLSRNIHCLPISFIPSPISVVLDASSPFL